MFTGNEKIHYNQLLSNEDLDDVDEIDDNKIDNEIKQINSENTRSFSSYLLITKQWLETNIHFISNINEQLLA